MPCDRRQVFAALIFCIFAVPAHAECRFVGKPDYDQLVQCVTEQQRQIDFLTLKSNEHDNLIANLDHGLDLLDKGQEKTWDAISSLLDRFVKSQGKTNGNL